jgi:ribosomal protein S18 acetylase RimI-like enzyme
MVEQAQTSLAKIEIRELRWPLDLAWLERLDTSFVTDAMYDVKSELRGFSLIERGISPPFRKKYSVGWSELTAADAALVAVIDDRVIGVGSLRYQEWNRRAVISHLYVDMPVRGKSAGTRLVQEMRFRAIELGARSLFVETQNVNVPAIRFYRRNGFTLVGLDTSLYDLGDAVSEVALFFAAPIKVS